MAHVKILGLIPGAYMESANKFCTESEVQLPRKSVEELGVRHMSSNF